jgi:DNA-binding transcriptional ArsR family regulator
MAALNETNRKAITKYLKKHPIERGKPNCYKEVSEYFDVLPEQIRRLYRTLREQGLIPGDPVEGKTGKRTSERSFRENVKTGQADVTLVTNKRIKTLKDLLAACEVNEKDWEVLTYEVNKWEVGRKEKRVDLEWTKGVSTGTVYDTGKIHVEPLWQVKAKLVRRKLGTDLVKQKEALLKELKRYSPPVGKHPVRLNKNESEQLLEICIFDPHFGKLAWREETDEDYDLKIAEARVKKAVKDLLGRVNLDNVKKILFPVGNDFINVDNRNNTTTAGTPQDTDVRFMKTIKTVKRILIQIIGELSQIAPIDVIIVPGNHDTTSSFMMGEILESFFFNNQRVNIDNAPKLRKYYRFGLNGIQLTHGNEEKHDSLGNIFATEQPKLWADTKFRFAQLGHFHKNKKTNYVSVDEFQGFQVHVIPSLSGTDAWHKSKGYNTLKQAKALLFDPNEGLIGEFTTTVS